jgi:hypothetical protein
MRSTTAATRSPSACTAAASAYTGEGSCRKQEQKQGQNQAGSKCFAM